MLTLEHEGKRLLRSWGIETPQGVVVPRDADAQQILASHAVAYPAAVKAQVSAGGRGKAGGVVKVENDTQAKEAVARLLATRYSGELPSAVLIEPWLEVERELYLSVTVDARAEGLAVLFAPRGGVEIEQGPPPARYAVGPAGRFRGYKLRQVLETVESSHEVRERVISLAQRLVHGAAAADCTTVEINPLARLADGRLVAVDAKVVRDDWASSRQSDIKAMLAEFTARQPQLLRDCIEMQHMYVELDGDVGLISGGAGMTMAAMDMIAEYGGRPACFLDASPGPTSTRGYRPAFALLDADPRIKVILVSVFGGGTQMQRVANAMRDLMRERTSKKPVVFRLDGTNVDQVPAILADINATNHGSLETAVKEAVALAGKKS